MLRFHLIVAVIATWALVKLSQAQTNPCLASPNPCLASPNPFNQCIWLSASPSIYTCLPVSFTTVCNATNPCQNGELLSILNLRLILYFFNNHIHY